MRARFGSRRPCTVGSTWLLMLSCVACSSATATTGSRASDASADHQSARAPDAHAPDAHAPEAHAPDAHAPDAHAPDAHAPDAHAQAPDAHAPDAHAADAHASDARSPQDAGISLESAFTAAGFTVQQGEFSFATNLIQSCCAGAPCFGNNPSSPYANFNLPPAPGETGTDGGLASTWRLRQDEAVLFVGRTPPQAKYFGYTSYLFDRANGSSRETLFASLGDTLNDLVIATAGAADGGPGDPFDSATAILFTANQTVAGTVEEVLGSAGTPPGLINHLSLSASMVNLGLDASSDTLQVLHRYAVPASAEAGAAYVNNNPQGTLYRLTPTSEVPAAPYPAPSIRSDSESATEASLAASVASLAAAITQANVSAQATTLAVANRTPYMDGQYGTYCIANGTDCAGDNRDTLYPTTPPFTMGASDFVVVYGVNHAATGLATYSSFSVYDATKGIGIVSVDDGKFVGSASAYVPDDPNVASLYAWKIARSCGVERYCTEIATTCPGIPLLGLGLIAYRMYMNPVTFTHPDPANIVLDGAIHFAP